MPPEAIVTSGIFTYTPQGFLCNGIARANIPTLASLDSALVLPRPKYARKKTYKPRPVTSKWYIAQLGHYNITPTTGTKGVLEERLRSAVRGGLCKHQPDNLRELEESMRETWLEKQKVLDAEEKERLEAEKKRNEIEAAERRKRFEEFEAGREEREKTMYANAVTDNEKLKVDGGKLWFEEFKRSGKKTAVLKHIALLSSDLSMLNICEIAEMNGAHAYKWHMESDPDHVEWCTVGYNYKATVARAEQEIKKYAPTAKRILKAKEDAKEAEARAFIDSMKEFLKDQPAEWDSTHILGTWKISCPEIREGWGHSCNIEGLKITLFYDCRNDIVGDLELGVIEGVLKLEEKPSAAKPAVEIYWVGREANGDIEDGDRKGRIEFSEGGAVARIVFGEISFIGTNVSATAVRISNKPVKGSVDFERYSREVYEEYYGEEGFTDAL